MEVSTTCKVAEIVLCNEAKNLIEELVQIDGAQRFDKEVIFEKLYLMWKRDGFGTVWLVCEALLGSVFCNCFFN